MVMLSGNIGTCIRFTIIRVGLFGEPLEQNDVYEAPQLS